MDFIAACVLYLLWRRRRNSDGSLASAKVLRDELIAGASGTAFRPDLKIDSVKKSLVRLEKAGMLVSATLPKDDSRSGPPPKGYRFSPEAPIIALRVTAAMVMHLHNHPNQRPRRADFVKEIYSLRWSHHSAPTPLDWEQIEQQIDYCIRRGYIQVVEAPGPMTEVPEERLAPTAKVDEYRMYLEKLAKDVKRQVTTEQNSADTAHSREPKAG